MTSNSTSGDDSFLDFVQTQNKEDGEFTVQAILASSLFSLISSLILFGIFLFLRRKHNAIYAPRLKYLSMEKLPPDAGVGWFSWLKPVIHANENDLMHSIGLDAVIFLRFTRMLRNLFLVLTLLGLGVLVPIYYYATMQTTSGNSSTEKNNPLALLSIQNAYGLWLLPGIIFAWISTVLTIGIIWWNFRACIRLRQDFFKSSAYKDLLNSKTILMVDIPQNFRTDERLGSLASQFGKKTYSMAHIERNVDDIMQLLEQHEKTIIKLEKTIIKYAKHAYTKDGVLDLSKLPKRPHIKINGERHDKIDYLATQSRILENKIKSSRESVLSRDALGVGFVSYPRIVDAHTVARRTHNTHPLGMTIKLAPRPNDIIWKKFSLSKERKAGYRYLGHAFVLALTILWTVPNAFIAIFITNIFNLGYIWPAFKTELSNHKTFWSIVQGLLGPSILSLFYLILPIIFRRISVWQGDFTKSGRERSVTRKLYFFFVLNQLIIFSLLGVIFSLITYGISIEQLNNEGSDISFGEAVQKADIPKKIGQAATNMSSFWIMYLVQRNVSTLVDLLQLFALVWRSLNRKIFSKTPRQLLEASKPPRFDFGQYQNWFLFITAVATVYGPIAPLVLPFAAIFFSLAHICYKYCFMYIYNSRYESDGKSWRILYNRILVASGLSILLLFSVVYSQSSWRKAIFSLPPLIFLIVFKIYCHYYMDPEFNFISEAGQDLRGLGQEPLQTTRPFRGKPVHPAFSAELLTVMVHSNAVSLLSKIHYTDSEYSTSDDKTDQCEGKYAIVSENELNYALVHKRPGFALDYDDMSISEGSERSHAIYPGDLSYRNRPGYSRSNSAMSLIPGDIPYASPIRQYSYSREPSFSSDSRRSFATSPGYPISNPASRSISRDNIYSDYFAQGENHASTEQLVPTMSNENAWITQHDYILPAPATTAPASAQQLYDPDNHYNHPRVRQLPYPEQDHRPHY